MPNATMSARLSNSLPKVALGARPACDAAVEAVEDHGDEDRDAGALEIAVDGRDDRVEAPRTGSSRQQVRQQEDARCAARRMSCFGHGLTIDFHASGVARPGSTRLKIPRFADRRHAPTPRRYGESPHAPVRVSDPEPQGSAGRSRDREPPAHAARRPHPAPRRRPLHLAADGPARPAQGRTRDPRGDEPRRRARDR